MKKILVLGLLLMSMVIMASPVMAEGGSWGIGAGIPYGYIGVNLDINIIPDVVDLSLGLGSHPSMGDDECDAYNAGLKFYLVPKERNFRPRLSCYYGTNTYVEDGYWGVTTGYTSYNGVTVGIGASLAFGHARRNGLDFDLLYCAHTEADLDQLEKEGYDISDFNRYVVSIGYRHYF